MQQQTSIEYVDFGHKITRETMNSYALHCHPMYEIYYFISGDVEYMVEGTRYEPSPQSLLLLRPGVFHGYRSRSQDRYERITLHVDSRLIPEAFQKRVLTPFEGDQPYHPQMEMLRPELEALKCCYAKEADLAEFAVQARVISVLMRLSDLIHGQEAPTENIKAAAGSDALLPQRLVAYLNVHLGENISLDSLAKTFFLSKSRLNDVFSQTMGTTITEYLRRKRLAYAQQLKAQGMSATEAAFRAGFRDYSTYYRTAKKAEKG